MRRRRSAQHGAAPTPRPSRRNREEAPGKLPEIAGCRHDRASYRNDRWTRETAPAGSYEHACPACERIADDHPTGLLPVGGDFAASQRNVLLRLLQNPEERELAEPRPRRETRRTQRGSVELATDATR